uniref:Uncharacterized protein n=1 Tax=Aegilops tauschii subsp. strangulata TaxID=200361 RepID=A0A452Z6M5_AEGTS
GHPAIIPLPHCTQWAPELSSARPLPLRPTSAASFHPTAPMLLPTRRLPATPSRPSAHPYISPARPSLRF